MHRIDGEGATSNNQFTEGNPSTGAIATTVTADFLNALQEEIAAVIEGAGIELTKDQNNQLMQAIQSLISGGGVAVTAEGVSIADAGEYFAGNQVEAALQQLAAKIYEGKFGAKQVSRSVIGLTGPSQQTEAAHAEAIVGLSHTSDITYLVRKDATLDLPNGTAIQLYQSGAGQVTVVADTDVIVFTPASFNPKSLEQNAFMVLVKTAGNRWRLGGTLEYAE